MSENIPHSLGGFRGAFESEHGRKPTEQEIWNAAIRSWRDITRQKSDSAKELEEVIADLLMYAGDNGYGHIDYADTMRHAAALLQSTAMPVSDASALNDMEACKDAAYWERNQLVALLSKLFPSGTKRTSIDGWSDDWHGCVYIDLPTGQASWHYHDSQAYLFEHLPPYAGEWDGHTTAKKYERIEEIEAPAAMPVGGLTDEQVHEGIKALMQCGNSDLESLSPKAYATYQDEVRRVYTAVAAASSQPVREQELEHVNCDDCTYHYKDADQKPCNTCIHSGDFVSNFEPRHGITKKGEAL